MFNNLRTRILAVIFAGAILIAIDGSTVYPILEEIQDAFLVNKSTVTWILNIEVIFIMLLKNILQLLTALWVVLFVFLNWYSYFITFCLVVSFWNEYTIRDMWC